MFDLNLCYVFIVPKKVLKGSADDKVAIQLPIYVSDFQVVEEEFQKRLLTVNNRYRGEIWFENKHK